LTVGGIYMIISYGQPENRIFHLVFFWNKIINLIETSLLFFLVLLEN
jgi:hypothetical protein